LFLCFGSGNLILLTELISVHVSKILPVRVISITTTTTTTTTTIIIITITTTTHDMCKLSYTLLCARKYG